MLQLRIRLCEPLLQFGCHLIESHAPGATGHDEACFSRQVHRLHGWRGRGAVQETGSAAESLDVRALVLAILALVLVFGARWSVLRVLAVCAGGGLLLSAFA